jgi:hypothetical protein
VNMGVIFAKPSQLCDHANLLFDCKSTLLFTGCLTQADLRDRKGCEGFVNMAPGVHLHIYAIDLLNVNRLLPSDIVRLKMWPD